MACTVNIPSRGERDCRSKITVNPCPISGTVKNPAFIGDILYFNIGEVKCGVRGLSHVPEWLVDGVTVEVDFEANSVTRIE